MPLFSNTLTNFLECIPNQTASIDELIMVISKNIPAIAQELNLGKMDFQIDAPATIFEPKGINNYCMLYNSPEGCNSNPIEDTYELPHNAGTMKLISASIKEYTWSDEQKTDIHMFHKCIYSLCSRSRLISMLSKVATCDPLTGVFNGPGFQRAGLALSPGSMSNYTGVFLNLKHFKYINQNFGNKVGDEALRKYANRLQNNLSEDELLARPGGDNFVVLIKNEHLEEFLRLLSSIRVNITLDSSVQGIDLPSRVGIYPATENDSIYDVMNKSSLAMAIAKRSVHHNHIWFRDEMIQRSLKQKAIIDVFPDALEKEEFEVYYQPKVNSKDYMLCGCEALARWNREGQMISPGEFIPTLEQNGNICMLDFYMLEHVCKDIRRWIESGITPVKVSVNFSKVHLHNRRLTHDIMSVINKYHIDPKYIEIELTESSAYDDFESLVHFVTGMKEHGVYTSIDDFGTGYSSLNLLKDLPIDVIKIDKSFLGNVSEQKKEEIIVIKAIMSMVNELDIEVVCEGVETKEQAEFLSTLGSPVFQGFYFDQPLPSIEFEKKLENKQYTL